MKHNKGFSLVELLVSIAILAIIMVMVVQFMGTASVSLRKTRKQMDLQTGALEFREQISDVLMQATYVRIETQNAKGYKLDTSLETVNGNTKRKRIDSSKEDEGDDKLVNIEPFSLPGVDASITKLSLVSDSYPNYCKAGAKDLDIYIDADKNTLFGRDKNDSTNTKITGTEGDKIRSLRILTEGLTGGDSYYVKPEYIYVRYQPVYNVYADPSDPTGSSKITDNTITSEQYVIYHFKDNKIYMYQGDVSSPATSDNDGFAEAVTTLRSNTGDNSAVTGVDKYVGLMVDLVKEFYISVNTDSNIIMLNAQLYDSDQPKSQRGSGNDSAYTQYIYDYNDSVILRNAHALTVAPNKLYKRRAKATVSSETSDDSTEGSSEETTP